MMFGHKKRFIPELNTTSTADISFMLLIFFLVTSSMDVDKGLTRQLPPFTKQEQQESVVSKKNLMKITITADNRTLIDEKPVKTAQVMPMISELIRRTGQRHLITIDCNPQAEYTTYFNLQNALVAAYTQWRNQTAMQKYGKPYKKLSPAQRDKIKELCPQRIAEQYNGTAGENGNQSQNSATEAQQGNSSTTVSTAQATNTSTQKGGMQ